MEEIRNLSAGKAARGEILAIAAEATPETWRAELARIVELVGEM